MTVRHILLFLVLLLIFVADSNACEVIDDAGQRIILQHPAQRIMSLAPDLTEMLFAVGAGSQIVGVIDKSDYPFSARKIPVVASGSSINIEKILMLRPDIIFVWSESHFAERLKQWGIPIFVNHSKKITDIPYTLRRLGCLVGHQEIANRASHDFLQRYEVLKKTYSHKQSFSVFYQIWSHPFMTITKNSWMNDVIALCGGKNIFENMSGVAPVMNIESIILANPDVIMASSVKDDWKVYWRQWSHLEAVKHQHLMSIPPELVERASPRILDGAETICQKMNLWRA